MSLGFGDIFCCDGAGLVTLVVVEVMMEVVGVLMMMIHVEFELPWFLCCYLSHCYFLFLSWLWLAFVRRLIL